MNKRPCLRLRLRRHGQPDRGHCAALGWTNQIQRPTLNLDHAARQEQARARSRYLACSRRATETALEQVRLIARLNARSIVNHLQHHSIGRAPPSSPGRQQQPGARRCVLHRVLGQVAQGHAGEGGVAHKGLVQALALQLQGNRVRL